ncbi:MAG TPA: triose-phosphate isomerase [Chloroflexota bacterium]|nr:triose-phosphate isomerase [Chloroflexota bacterium]
MMQAVPQRRPLVAANWKMNTTPSQARELAAQTLAAITAPDHQRVEVVLCPPAVSLVVVREVIGTRCGLGAQNIHWEERGAFTGEISAPMVAELCDLVIVGHSERRQYFGETDETVHRKILAALAHGLTPLLCVGESRAQREAGQTHDLIGLQLRGALHGLSPDQITAIVVAYEPVWAIGTGVSASGADANIVGALIRRILVELGDDGATAVRVLYGGSVSAANAGEFLSQPEIDGALVGGASLKAAEFAAIVHAAADHH